MSRKFTGTIHDEAMDRLCFLCADLIKDDKWYDVEEHLQMICRVLNRSIFTLPGLTPDHFCKNCLRKLRHSDNGRNATTSLKVLEWAACGPDCASCAKLTKRTQVRGRKKKVSCINTHSFL